MRILNIVPVTLFCTLLSAHAFSETDKTGFFIGGQLGTTDINENSSRVDYEESGNNLGLILGYHFSDWFGLDTQVNHSSHNSLVSTSLIVAPKFSYWASPKSSIYIKPGLNYTNLYNDDGPGFWDRKSGLGAAMGIGATYAITDSLHTRLAYDYTTIGLEDQDQEEADVDTKFQYISLGLYYQF